MRFDVRRGEALWSEWDGDYLDVEDIEAPVFVTYEHISPDIEVVRNALASAIQRSGLVDSLAEARTAIQRSYITQGYSGVVDDDYVRAVCDQDGETFLGDKAEDVKATTWVEVVI